MNFEIHIFVIISMPKLTLKLQFKFQNTHVFTNSLGLSYMSCFTPKSLLCQILQKFKVINWNWGLLLWGHYVTRSGSVIATHRQIFVEFFTEPLNTLNFKLFCGLMNLSCTVFCAFLFTRAAWCFRKKARVVRICWLDF